MAMLVQEIYTSLNYDIIFIVLPLTLMQGHPRCWQEKEKKKGPLFYLLASIRNSASTHKGLMLMNWWL